MANPMHTMLAMTDLDLAGKRVLIREDLNVPLADGAVRSDARIRACLPTLHRALRAGARVMLMSHLGRPREGHPEPEFSLGPVAERLGELLGDPVPLVVDWERAAPPEPGHALLWENVRFNPGEGADDEDLGRRMAAACDVFVMDAFATAHRAQASTHAVARFAPTACAGPLLLAELDALSKVLSRPEHPLVAIVGGAKVSTKMGVLSTLVEQVDTLIVGGGIANTFIAAAGHPVGLSLHEPGMLEEARRLVERAAARGAGIPLPEDVLVAPTLDAQARPVARALDEVDARARIGDIGPRTARRYARIIGEAKTILWNGPLGVFEIPAFAAGTEVVARAIAGSEAFSVAGGGDTLAAIDAFGVGDRISYISTGGGAFLELVEGVKLPAVAILEERASGHRQ